MNALTIYCCGTGYNRNKIDIVSTLNLETMQNHIILDGPGSGPGFWRTPADKGFTPGASGVLTGGLFGVGLDANITAGRDWVAGILREHPVSAINMCGWSRGGVTCLKFAHAVNALTNSPDWQAFKTHPMAIDVNIFAIDPVPGSTGPANAHSWRNVGLAPNVRRYTVVYAQHESRRQFAPIVPSQLGRAFVTMEVMAGTHSSVAGTMDNLELFGESAELVYDMAKRFLMSCGTKFVRRSLLDSTGILERYAKILLNFDDYQRVGKKGFGLGGLGVGSPKRSLQSDKGVQLPAGFTPEKIPGFFVNDHHRDAMMAQYPSLVGLLDEFDKTEAATPTVQRAFKWKVDEGALRRNAITAHRSGAVNDLRRMKEVAPETLKAARSFLRSHGEHFD